MFGITLVLIGVVILQLWMYRKLWHHISGMKRLFSSQLLEHKKQLEELDDACDTLTLEQSHTVAEVHKGRIESLERDIEGLWGEILK
tara:strand:+ start:6337 stop:6597 length:261 start_codon:yes stop_codon:yes gene_type:complete